MSHNRTLVNRLALALLAGCVAGALTPDGAIADGNLLVPSVIKTIPLGLNFGAYMAKINVKTNRIYITNLYTSTVSVIDGKTDTVIDTIAIPNSAVTSYTPPGPTQVAIDEETNTLYVLTNHGTIAVVNGATDQITSYFTFETYINPNGDGFDTRSIVRSKKTGKLYVSYGTFEIEVVDPKTQTVIKRIPDAAAGPLSIDQRTNTIYTSAPSGVFAIDGDTDEMKTVISVPAYALNGGLEGSAVDEELHHIYIGGEFGGLVTIDTTTNAVLNSNDAWSQQVSSYAIAVDPINHGAYAINFFANMAVVDGVADNLVANNVSLGTPFLSPNCPGICPGSFVPSDVEVNPKTGKIYVVNTAIPGEPDQQPDQILVLQIPQRYAERR
jgi:YVTN family beta-propeller protein